MQTPPPSEFPIHPMLAQSVRDFVARYEADARVVGLYLYGSLGRGDADAHSDVDLVVVVEDEHFAALEADIRPACEAVCGPNLAVWFREVERPDVVSVAFLFEREGYRFIYDYAVATKSWLLGQVSPAHPGRIIFDRDGTLATAKARPKAPDDTAAAGLEREVAGWWVFAFTNGKYLRRGDLFKMLHVQQTMFESHRRVLRVLHPEGDWGIWPIDLRRLDPAHRQALLAYFPGADIPAVCRALAAEIALFSRDARLACERVGLPYPKEAERFVSQYLRGCGVLGENDMANHPTAAGRDL